MNVPLITMTPTDAREELRQVRTALHRRADTEYEAIATGLAAMAGGAIGIISLREAIQSGGFDAKGRPRLAIARADRKQVAFSWTSMGRAHFSTRIPGWHGAETLVREVQLDSPRLSLHDRWPGYALVPMIPARVRNTVRFKDRDTFILWEVEQWSDERLQSRPDRDPYLLRHLAGDAYAVLAEWDLTELERMVMAGRRTQA